MQDRLPPDRRTSCNARPDHTCGSNSEVAALPRHFCFAPMNGHRETQRPSPFCASIVNGCQRQLHERPYCAVPSTAFTFTMKLLWIRICFIAGNCMTVWADVGPRMPTM